MTSAQAAAVVALCSEVFEMDYGALLELFPARMHVLGYADGRLVAHALWLDRPLRVGDGPWLAAAYVEGVATAAAYRRRGYGSAVMRRLQEAVAGYDLAALSPAEPEWYERLGWERWQGPLWIERQGVLEATPPDECVMIYRTPRTPALDLTAPLTAPWRPGEVW
ncbi:MAG: GNAT family N-acetyltransferase [Anaerolineae bacterium]|nr:GNAT family N-acetyltransferase [Anaerolineae bacterium]